MAYSVHKVVKRSEGHYDVSITDGTDVFGPLPYYPGKDTKSELKGRFQDLINAKTTVKSEEDAVVAAIESEIGTL